MWPFGLDTYKPSHDFKNGDIVRLRTGDGPDMVVAAVEYEIHVNYWIDGGVGYREIYASALVRKAK